MKVVACYGSAAEHPKAAFIKNGDGAQDVRDFE